MKTASTRCELSRPCSGFFSAFRIVRLSWQIFQNVCLGQWGGDDIRLCRPTMMGIGNRLCNDSPSAGNTQVKLVRLTAPWCRMIGIGNSTLACGDRSPRCRGPGSGPCTALPLTQRHLPPGSGQQQVGPRAPHAPPRRSHSHHQNHGRRCRLHHHPCLRHHLLTAPCPCSH